MAKENKIETEISNLQKTANELCATLRQVSKLQETLNERTQRLLNVYQDAIYNENLSECGTCPHRHDGSDLQSCCRFCKIDYAIRDYEQKNNVPAYRRF